MKLPSDVDISPTKIIDLVTAVVAGNASYSEQQLRQFAGFDPKSSYFDNCVTWAIILKLVRRDASEILVPIKAGTRGISDALTNDHKKKEIFAKALLRWPPYMMFLANIGQGLALKDSTNRVRAHFELENAPDFVGNLFSGWGLKVDLLKKGVGRNSVVLSDRVREAQAELKKSVGAPPESEAARRLKVESALGPDAFSFLHEDEIGDLVEALGNYLKDPRDAVNRSGAAAEDFLRRIASDLSVVKAARANGLAELAEALYNHNDKSGNLSPVIHDKHRKLAHAIASIRVMGAHGKDKRHLERWTLTSEPALGQIYLSLAFIRSVYAFVRNGGALEF